MTAPKIQFLEPKQVKLWLIEGTATIRCEIDGDRCILETTVRRVFPLSNPDSFITIEDGAGKEAGVIRDLRDLDSDSLSTVRNELERRYFTPRIESILDLAQEEGIWTFDVRTQRGPVRFFVRNWRDNSHEIQPGRWQIRSVDGQRYDIPNFDALDHKSKEFLEMVF